MESGTRCENLWTYIALSRTLGRNIEIPHDVGAL